MNSYLHLARGYSYALITIVVLFGRVTLVRAQPALERVDLESSPAIAHCTQFSPDGKFIVGESKVRDNSFNLWSSETGKVVRSFQGHIAPVNCVAFSVDGKKVISGSADMTVKIWSVESAQMLRTLSGHTGPVTFIALSDDGKLIASASADKTVRIWDSSGEAVRKLDDPRVVMTVAFSPDSQIVAGAGVEGNVKLWDVSSGKLLRTLQDPQIKLGLIISISYSANNSLIAAAINNLDPTNPSPTNTVQVWDANTGQRLQKFSAPVVGLDTLTSVVFSPDGNWISAASVDALATPPKITGRVWGVNTGAPLCSQNGTFIAAISLDGRQIATGSGSGLSVRNGRNVCAGQ